MADDDKTIEEQNKINEQIQNQEIDEAVNAASSDDGGNHLIVQDLSTEMQRSYLNYAMSVIVARALPDVRDGLKPVHRRILFDMNELGIKASGEFKKSARIVGDVLGKYHPHGDASVYDAMVRLAQDFSLRYPVVAPHGNFGSVDGDPAAAMRYTEAKLSPLGEEMLTDINKETVNMIPNYDESLKEPEVLPSALPYLILNGTNGIAVGMATNMAPHNLRETTAAICAQIDNPNISVTELMEYIKGPDFPTRGIICGIKGIRDAFETGVGKVTIRARYHIEEHREHSSIVFTEIPYQVNKAELHKRIVELRKETIKGIGEVRDESSEKEGVRLVVDLKKGAVAAVVVNYLFKHTALQSNFNINNIAIVDGKPKRLNLKDMIHYYVRHREDVVTRRTKFDLRKAEERAHILLGLKIGLENIDEVIKTIKESKDNAVASIKLQEKFGLTEIQAKAIIDMKLGRLSNLETQQILDELAELERKIQYYKELLADENKILGVIKDEITAMSAKYGDDRRTEIQRPELGDVNAEDFIKKEDVIVTATKKGFVKRLPLSEYKAQHRGGKGVKGLSLRGEDSTDFIFSASSHDYVLYITSLGKAYFSKVYDIEESAKTGKGSSIKSILQVQDGEELSAVLPFKGFDDERLSMLMMTKKGVAKRTELSLLKNARTKGVKAVTLDEDDELAGIIFVNDDDDAMVITKQGRGLRFNVGTIREMGRTAHGVKGIKLRENDEVVGLVKVEDNKTALVVATNGKGKQVDFSLFACHGRGTGGQIIYKCTDDVTLVSALSVNKETDDLVCITAMGQTIRMHVRDISEQGRAAQGVYVFKMRKADDHIVAIEVVPSQSDENEGTEETEGTSEPNEGNQE